MNTKEGIAKKEEKLAVLLNAADGHPLMKRIMEDNAAATVETRIEAAGKIELLKKERDELLPKLQADLEEKEACTALPYHPLLISATT